jgi:hypothetical protein
LLNAALIALGDDSAMKSRQLRAPVVPPRSISHAGQMPHAA